MVKHTPKDVWVHVLNDTDGSVVQVQVGVEYSALPHSCGLCKAFRHSLARCHKNPNAQASVPGSSKTSTGNDTFMGCVVETDHEPSSGG